MSRSRNNLKKLILPLIFLLLASFAFMKTEFESFVKNSFDEYVNLQKSYGIDDGAVVVMNPHTLKILAKAGDIYKPHGAGSIFKPVVYAAAFEKGYTPETIVNDEETDFFGYKPRNFDDTYLGKITVRKTLARSRNIPAVAAYFYAGGQKPVIEMAKRLGINSLDYEFDYGAPLALGSAKIPLFEMTRAYAVLAASGKYKNTQVLNENIARDLSDILADDKEKLGEPLKISGIKVSAKTGTGTTVKDGYVTPSDLWTIGYTDDVVVGVWLGNKTGKPLRENADGVNNAAPLWNKIMTKTLSDY